MGQRLKMLNASYRGAAFDPTEPHECALAAFEEMQARRFLGALPQVLAPTLPLSAWRRHLLLQQLQPSRVLLLEDNDGQAVTLAAHSDVVVVQPEGPYAQWLHAEVERAGCGARVQIVTAGVGALAPVGIRRSEFDCVCLGWHGFFPAEAMAQLAAAVQWTRLGGHLLVRLRPCWQEACLAAIRGLGLAVVRRVADMDHPVLPGLFVADQRSVTLVLQRPEAQEFGDRAHLNERGGEPLRGSAITSASAPAPFAAYELCQLAPKGLSAAAMERFADGLTASMRAQQARRQVHAVAGGWVVWWCDGVGRVVTGQVQCERACVRLTLLSPSVGGEYALLSAAFAAFADELTRVRLDGEASSSPLERDFLQP